MKLLDRLGHAWRGRTAYRSRVPYSLWQDCLARIPVLATLDRREQHRLRRLTGRFLRSKTISGAGGLEVDDPMRVHIAAQACLLILNIGFDFFRGWSEVIVYPGTFVVTMEEFDNAGVIHETRRPLGGEAWDRGPVVISWPDAQPDSRAGDPAYNVILHEFAHKLDMLNGSANGMPPLHQDMVREQWTAAFSLAYERLYQELAGSRPTEIDPYAGESPAEFFAVVTENFFERPERLHHFSPAVYEQLRLFYRQDPLRRPRGTLRQRSLKPGAHPTNDDDRK